MNLKTRMAVALTIPLVTTMVFLGMMVLESQRGLANMRALGSVVALADRASAVIHEMQIERGLSVGYISAGREPGQLEALSTQRDKVNAVVARFKGFLDESRITAGVPSLAEPLAELGSELSQIAAFRTQVEEDVAPGDAANFYTARIERLIALIHGSIEFSPTVEIATLLRPYVDLVEAKEHGGLERAFGAALFNQASAGAVDHALFLR